MLATNVSGKITTKDAFCTTSGLGASNPTQAIELAVMPWALMMSVFMAPVPFITLGCGVVAWTKLLHRVSARGRGHPERQPRQADAPDTHLS